MLDFLVKLEDGLPDVLGIQLVVVGEHHGHHVIGVESTFNHPLALENLLLHRFEPRLHASGPPWSLNITDVQQSITHLNGLRVLQHLREVRVDDRLEELVLAGAWRHHDDLDLSEKQLETKTEDICVIRELKPSGDYILNFYRPKYVTCKKTEFGEHTRCPRGRGRALHPRGRLESFSDYFLFSYFLKYSKTEKNWH